MNLRWLTSVSHAFLFAAIFCLPAVNVRAGTIYTIGNSLTWDTQPNTYATDWHIACGRALPFILSNPTTTCVDGTLWTTALAEQSFDIVTVQPFFGSTIQSDANAIEHWMVMQPNATFWIHSGWPGHATIEQAYNAGNPNDTMVHSAQYFNDLISELETRMPDREIYLSRGFEALEFVRQDIENGLAPFGDITELYRDNIHLDSAGKYLQANLLRANLDIEPTTVFTSLSIEKTDYLDSVIARTRTTAIPEPGISAMMGLCLAAGIVLRFKRKFASARDSR